MNAIKAALDDTDSEIGLTWKVQKLSAHSQKRWEAGAYLSPVLGFEPPGYENATDKITVRTLACLINPSEMALVTGMHDELKKMNRVEAIFRQKSGAAMPASLRALNTIDPDPGWRVQITRIQPADRFVASAFQLGYDASATIIETEITLARSFFNFSALGA